MDHWNGNATQVRIFQSLGITFPLCMNAYTTKNIYTEVGFYNDFSVIIDQSGIISYKGAGAYLPSITSWIDNLLLTSIDKIETILPVDIKLDQNYPNPFNPITKIKFHIKQTQYVNLEIYDVTGKLIRKLIDNKMNAGSHELYWDGRDAKGNHLHSGVYFYSLKTKDFFDTKKMLYIK